MKRTHKIQVGQLNIVTHPHSPEKYKELFEFISSNRLSSRFYGARTLLIPTSKVLSEHKLENCIYGSLFTYSEFDFDESWLNLAKLDGVQPADIQDLNIPDNVKPEFKAFRYVFDLTKHQLVYECTNPQRHTFSPRLLERALTNIFSHPKVIEKFGKVEVTAVPEIDALDKILSIHSLNTLAFRVIKPNPDDDDYEERIFASMERQNIRQRDEVLKKETDEVSIRPDADTTQLLQIAQNNGYVNGEGRNIEGKKVSESTKSRPKKVDAYFPSSASPLGALASKVREWLR